TTRLCSFFPATHITAALRSPFFSAISKPDHAHSRELHRRALTQLSGFSALKKRCPPHRAPALRSPVLLRALKTRQTLTPPPLPRPPPTSPLPPPPRTFAPTPPPRPPPPPPNLCIPALKHPLPPPPRTRAAKPPFFSAISNPTNH